LSLKERVTSAFIDLLTRIGFAFIGLWSRKRIVLPLLLVASITSWQVASTLPCVITLNLALLVTSTFFTILLIGVTVIADIEGGLTSLERIPKIVAGALVAVVMVYLTLLLYLNGVLIGSLPLLEPMSLLLAPSYALEVALLVTLAVVVPPTLGYFLLRRKWFDVRRRYPFWGAYLGILSALLFAYPTTHDLSQSATWWTPSSIASALTFVASLALIIGPKKAVTKVAGLILILLGISCLMVCLNYTMLSSMLAIIGGAFAYSWSGRGR